MKLVWSPETASKAYIDTVKSFDMLQQSGEAEFISALAGGHKGKFIVETWSQGGDILTSIGLAIARKNIGGKHVCIVQDSVSRSDYIKAMGVAGRLTEVIVGEPEDIAEGLVGIDFLVLDSRLNGFTKILRLAKLSSDGAVLVCKNARLNFGWRNVLDIGSFRRVVRSVFVPIGKGFDIAYLSGSCRDLDSRRGRRSWIKHVKWKSGEEHVFFERG